ncbi:hypothetical protein [Isoptericola dokdonensis]|jgi:hypothetical protein|uniref:Uncharacterized protein n=1 Tax=Isoptericola dokdonensis DS-3 TaxID=1300344 RepID=A0A168E810_9MICO|nr:hypothetical protein [Isoptericola dokdonensis]ANC29711.1 hypothetical protein I598_0118 [Isoptericola dokdonensis DS-3]
MEAPTTAAARPAVGSRRAGYLVGAAVQVLLLVGLHGWPGWESAPFLTARTVEVLPAVDAAIVVGLVAQLVYVVADPPRLRALGDVVVTAVGLVAIVTVWNVFPFTFPGQTFDWELLVRILLVLGAVGSVLVILAGLVRLVTGKG